MSGIAVAGCKTGGGHPLPPPPQPLHGGACEPRPAACGRGAGWWAVRAGGCRCRGGGWSPTPPPPAAPRALCRWGLGEAAEARGEPVACLGCRGVRGGGRQAAHGGRGCVAESSDVGEWGQPKGGGGSSGMRGRRYGGALDMHRGALSPDPSILLPRQGGSRAMAQKVGNDAATTRSSNGPNKPPIMQGRGHAEGPAAPRRSHRAERQGERLAKRLLHTGRGSGRMKKKRGRSPPPPLSQSTSRRSP